MCVVDCSAVGFLASCLARVAFLEATGWTQGAELTWSNDDSTGHFFRSSEAKLRLTLEAAWHTCHLLILLLFSKCFISLQHHHFNSKE